MIVYNKDTPVYWNKMMYDLVQEADSNDEDCHCMSVDATRGTSDHKDEQFLQKVVFI